MYNALVFVHFCVYNEGKNGEKRGPFMKKVSDILNIVSALENDYADALCSLEYDKDYELLFAVRLSAQCTDERVNQVMPSLCAAYPTLEAFASADVEDVEKLVKSCGFYHMKARDIVASAQMLLRDYGGKVPDSMEELLKLPGVGRKTANLILGDIYGQPAIVADTHCIRISNRLGLCDFKDPVKVESQLKEQIPPEKSNNFCHRLVLHGRAVCDARKPKCEVCSLAPWCDFCKGRETQE